jgi:prefoldin subunit 5
MEAAIAATDSLRIKIKELEGALQERENELAHIKRQENESMPRANQVFSAETAKMSGPKEKLRDAMETLQRH